MAKHSKDELFDDIIDAACYGAIISLEGEIGTKRELKEYAYEVELMEEQRMCMKRNLRFFGKEKLKKGVSDYIDEWYGDEVASDEEPFEIHQ